MSRRTGASVFPYSLFFVFFDQYAHIVSIAQQVLGLGLASVLVVTALFLGSWRSGIIVTGVVALTVVNVMGVMGLWGVSLNAISLVNLVISLGIAVEFCAHVARSFMNSGSGVTVDHSAEQERDERMSVALVDVGLDVLYRHTISGCGSPSLSQGPCTVSSFCQLFSAWRADQGSLCKRPTKNGWQRPSGVGTSIR